MKLRVPEGCLAVSHAGQSIKLAEDGSVEVEDGTEKVLILHGFTLWEDQRETPSLAAMTREQLVTQVMSITRKAVETISTEDIRKRLVVAEASIPAPSVEEDEPENAGASITISDIGVEDISVLSRKRLFAYLRAKGVSVSLPVTTEALRAAARHALGTCESR
jgi:hypothetical protein